ncbi:hypothetical protein [Cellulomonas sp. P24]|uniref:hypothetical protein n=1 Tax=Cellulomonas sp. P24 TaxID=2885206 RepID=UPI00216B19B9|nr:hypothetical protein [Cellulomonas sp. P24]MCR6494606.1 hypothetical protein [Cellulomonas sp. P24]
MGTTRSTPWIVAAAFGSLVILALTWLLAISPELAAADDSRSQATAQQSQNVILKAKIVKLADQFTHLDEYKATLATLREQIPEKIDLTAVNRGLSTLAATSGVTIFSVTTTTPTGFAPVQGAAAPTAAPATDSAGSAASGASGSSTATSATQASAVPKGFYAVPLTITLGGTYDQTTAFLSSFQTGSGRIFLATGITATSQQAAGASSGRPAVAAGDLSLTITGYAYVLLGPTATTATPAPSTTAPTLPAPSGQKNPFQSVS